MNDTTTHDVNPQLVVTVMNLDTKDFIEGDFQILTMPRGITLSHELGLLLLQYATQDFC